MIDYYKGKPVTLKTIEDFSDIDLIVLLASRPYHLYKEYDLETLTREELLNLAKRYLF